MPIINGVEVSDCIYYEPKALKMTCHEQAITKPCGTSPICYYKLLHKAYKNCECLEQENKTLKSQLDFEVQKKEVLEAENEKLKASNRNLKLNLETYNLPEVKKILTFWHTGELDLQEKRLKKQEAENKMYKKDLESEVLLKAKYYLTLQEIKEIVSEPCLDDENCITCNSNCSNKDILKLIKKAEEE